MFFSFDGEYRRKPQQSLGGSSISTDREQIIRKAAEERLKRNQIRRETNGAIVLQSYTRSFLFRQRRKRFEREQFDEFFRSHRTQIHQDENLAFLLRRLLFFYNTKETKDGERLIEICQQILKSPARILQNSTVDSMWLHRLKKLLDICIVQLTSTSQTSQALPLRMLETFTSEASIERFVENDTLIQKYLEYIFQYLIKNDYFKRLRSLLENKCPPLDGEILHSPNQFSEAVFQLLLRPLLLANNPKTVHSCSNSICLTFAKEILSLPYTDCIQYFLLPCLAEHEEFPFELIVRILQKWTKSQMPPPERMDVDAGITPTFTGASALTSSSKKTTSKASDADSLDTKGIFSTYLLNSILILDNKQLPTLHTKSLLGDYIKIIAEVSSKILQLPKSTLKHSSTQPSRHGSGNGDTSSEDDSEDEDNDYNAKHKSHSMDIDVGPGPVAITDKEKECLLQCISLLNQGMRVQAIVENIEDYLNDNEVLYGLCEICHNLMIYNKMAMFEYKLLYTLSFLPNFIRAVWFNLVAQSKQQGFNAPLTLISKGVVPKQPGSESFVPLLATFCMLFGRLLPTLHDNEFCDEKLLIEKSLQTTTQRLMPFSLSEIVQLSKTLKEVSLGLVELAFPETRSNLNQHYRFILGRSDSDDAKMKQQKQIWANLLKVVVFVLNQIYTRDLRLGFCPESHWTVTRLDLPLDRPTDLPLTRGSRTRGIRPFQPIRDFTREDFENGPPMSTKQIRSITILREIPFVVSFSKRVGILQGLMAADKMRVQGNLQAFLQGPSIMLTVRRSHLYEDAYDKLRPENEPDLRLKFRVQFVSSLGLDEAGIDGGGVFREFLSELIKTAFDPNRGFFMVTTDNKLYPNPSVSDLVPDFEKHYYFIGRIIGKAIYENLLVELPLAEFFLTKLAGKYADVDIHQLASLDPELYKNLLYLKDYDGDVSELNLDFTVASSSFGQTQVIELKPQGQSIPVTNSNRIEYLQLMADYKLNQQIRKHCIAFRKGLSNVVCVEWLYMFSNKELQILISGAEIPIDLEDLKKHCKYGGEYGPEHPSIIAFWAALESFDDLQKRQLLKFVTSCSRPPLLGFKDLDPPFFIQNAGDMERLPTASTCTNLLKLPPFKTVEQMREKLLYAIQSGVGFELS
ncbi:ubiquitin-protein ligase E3C [Haematobia irritans]|uniref:ubiquitin-protein ligase E3C n=1 Tax=Haematobia irritans TaxID=7368 RepID=UPI003F4F99E9